MPIAYENSWFYSELKQLEIMTLMRFIPPIASTNAFPSSSNSGATKVSMLCRLEIGIRNRKMKSLTR
jgi:hypothetical protein